MTATTSPQSASATVYVTNYPGTFTHHNDNLRSGLNANETVLSPSNVNQTQFGKLFAYTLMACVCIAVVCGQREFPNLGVHNVVYLATEHDSVYAFDADG